MAPERTHMTNLQIPRMEASLQASWSALATALRRRLGPRTGQ
jgi:hypothetical protein